MKAMTLALTLVVVTACAKSESNADSAAPGTATQGTGADRAVSAAAISNAIAANPDKADSILTANNQTRASFDQLMYDIASDSAASARYAAAKSR